MNKRGLLNHQSSPEQNSLEQLPIPAGASPEVQQGATCCVELARRTKPLQP